MRVTDVSFPKRLLQPKISRRPCYWSIILMLIKCILIVCLTIQSLNDVADRDVSTAYIKCSWEKAILKDLALLVFAYRRLVTRELIWLQDLVLVGRLLAAEIGVFLTPLFIWTFASLVHCRRDLLLLCFLIKSNEASGLSILLSLLMLLECSLMWIFSFTLCVSQWGSRSITDSKIPALHEVEKLKDASHRFYSLTVFLCQKN